MTKQREVGRSRHGKADAARPSHVRGHDWLHTAHQFLSDTICSRPTHHSRPARPSRKGEGCAAASGRLARPAETPLEKALRAAGPPLFRTSELRFIRPTADSAGGLVPHLAGEDCCPPLHHKVTHTARPRSCSGPAPCRPCPGQEPAPGRVASVYGRVHDCHPARCQQQTLSG